MTRNTRSEPPPEFGGESGFAVSLGKQGVHGQSRYSLIEGGRKYVFSNPVARLLWRILPDRRRKELVITVIAAAYERVSWRTAAWGASWRSGNRQHFSARGETGLMRNARSAMLRIVGPALLLLSLVDPAVAQQPQSSAAAIDSTLFLIRTMSVHRDRVNWTDVEGSFRERLAQATAFHDSLSAFVSVFRALDDVHSSIYHGDRQYAYYRGASDEEAARVRPLIARANTQRGRAEGYVLEGTVGYLVIPTIYTGADELARHAGEIRERVCELLAQGATRWIVDLRLNMGGNMHPMLSGVGPLIGDGDIGGIVDIAGNQVAHWSIRGGVNHVNGEPVVRLDAPRCEVPSGQPIAVLVGPVTMSSGQIVAVALAGRPRTRSFGETTADGYTTANQWIQLTPELALNLSVGFIADRAGRIYNRVVEPDEHVDGLANFDDAARDATVRAAMLWLTGAR